MADDAKGEKPSLDTLTLESRAYENLEKDFQEVRQAFPADSSTLGSPVWCAMVCKSDYV